MGIECKTSPDELIIRGGCPKAAEINGFNDHRIVMAFSIAASFINGKTIITDSEAINKSYPLFFKDLKRLGGNVDVI